MNIKYYINKNKDYIKDIIAYVKIKYLWIGVVVVWGIARVLTGICVASEAAARAITIFSGAYVCCWLWRLYDKPILYQNNQRTQLFI